MKRTVLLSIVFLIMMCGRPEPPDVPIFTIMSVCSLPGYAEDMDIVADYAYIANDQGGLQIVDISDPTSPIIIGAYLSEKSIVDVAVRDTFAYCAVLHKDGGVRIINVADPTQPYFVGQDNWYYGYGVTAPENDTMFVYVAGGYWFVVEDVSDPMYPTFVRRFSYAGDFRAVHVIDSIAFLACEQMGVLIYNLASPDTVPVGQIDTPSNARNIIVVDDYAYVADGRAGVVIINVSDISKPALVTTFDTPQYANDVFVTANYAYVADGECGLQVIDVSDPEEPMLYGTMETSYANAVYVRDSLIYVADRDMGLIIIVEEE